jgi:hypothetical protein
MISPASQEMETMSLKLGPEADEVTLRQVKVVLAEEAAEPKLFCSR